MTVAERATYESEKQNRIDAENRRYAVKCENNTRLANAMFFAREVSKKGFFNSYTMKYVHELRRQCAVKFGKKVSEISLKAIFEMVKLGEFCVVEA